MSPQPTISPLDEHNRALLEQLYPSDWRNPTPASRYNLLVVGGGPAGLVAAIGAAGLGAKVALVEKRLLLFKILGLGKKGIIHCPLDNLTHCQREITCKHQLKNRSGLRKILSF